MQAVNLILDALPRAYHDGSDLKARSAMANAATIAGLAFSNAFVGLNHALAHAVGARFGIAHGRANAIFLPHVLRYNASLPSKFMPAPGTRPTSHPRSMRRSGGSSASADAPSRIGASGCSSASTSCWPRSASRARWPTAA
jgi:Alcohol dehydrogenase, class IV